MTSEILRPEVQGGMTWGSNAITGQQLPDEVCWIDKPGDAFGGSMMDKGMADTRIPAHDHWAGRSSGSVYLADATHSGKAYYILSPFLGGDRVGLQNMRGTVVGQDADVDALWVVGPSVAVQMIRAESTEGYSAWPSAKDATNVPVFDPEREKFVNSYFQKIIRDAGDEVFLDGMESVFANQLKILVESYGGIAVRAIEGVVGSGDTNIEIVGELLRVIGSVEDPATHGVRLSVLLTSLASPDPRVRDSASLGIAALDDPSVVDFVVAAVEREQILELRRNLQLVVDQLKLTEWRIS